MKSFGIILIALATGATAHPFHLSSLFARQATTCAVNTDCPATQFCAGAVCEIFDDCRGTEGSCPGGSCSPVPGTVDGDAQNPTRAYECSFASASASASSAGSTAVSSSAAASASASVSTSVSASASVSVSVSASGSASSAPSPSATTAPGGTCAVNADCASTQYCSSANETSICVLLRDCRGELGSCAGGSCVAENSTFAGDAQDPNQAFICSFVSASASSSSSSSGPASSSAAASSSAPASASSASATAAPIPSAEPSTSAAPAPSSSPAPAPAPTPKPKPSKEEPKPAPAPTTTSKPKHPKDDAWRDEHKDGQKGDDKKYCDQSKIEALLWEIKGELKGLKWEVEQLKASK